MSLQYPFLSVLKSNPPPLWYVTNGEITVGPVNTKLLVRGVEVGRVPDYCRVSAEYGIWRGLESVRELASRNRPADSVSEAREALLELVRPRERIRDQEALCHQVTCLSMLVTGAESGMLHLRDRSHRSFFTRAVLGPLPHSRLGEAVPETDLVLRSAMLGRPLLGPPFGAAEDALALRFAATAGGVGGAAMLPIFVGHSLEAMLELSRPGHAFRRIDLKRAERIAQRALYQHAHQHSS